MELWKLKHIQRNMNYLPVRLLICLVWSCNKRFSLLTWRALMCIYGIVSPSPKRKDITRSWYLGPSPPSWVILANTAAIRRSKTLSLFMYVIILTHDLVLLMRMWWYLWQYEIWLIFIKINSFILLWKILYVSLVGGEI